MSRPSGARFDDGNERGAQPTFRVKLLVYSFVEYDVAAEDEDQAKHDAVWRFLQKEQPNVRSPEYLGETDEFTAEVLK